MPFKSGAFRTALMLNMPILPISIEGAWELMRPSQLLPDFGTVRVKVHAAIETSGLDDSTEQVRELMQHARSRIAAGIDELQAQPSMPQPQSKLHEN